MSLTPASFLQRAARRLNKDLSSLFFIDQWVIMTARGGNYDSLQWSAFRPLVPDKDRYWGDPFIIPKGDRYFVFIEEKIYATGLGRIACLTLDAEGQLLSSQAVLERPYHLSYPFLFEQEGETFMIPESAGNRSLELYHCAHFPDRWEFVKTLMKDIYAVDATLLQHENKYWLFANVKKEGGSSLDALHLFYADSPFANKWTPHRRNPIVKDIHSARPAGRIFMQEGGLIRPSQDSARRYGHALRFNRIIKLDEDDYAETEAASFRPPGGKMLATHTFNQAGEMTVIDAIIRRRK
jgi:hypothetical protein